MRIPKILTYFLVCLIVVNVFLSAWFPIHKDLFFHTDIARDFLLLEDIYHTHKPTLIGPRSGGIPGFFHGPAWLYINFPAYLLGRQNPVAVAWFWVFLSIISIVMAYWVGKKLFDKETGLLSALLLSVFSISYTSFLFNPFGALILTPLFFYFFYLYTQKLKALYLVISLFLLGMIIQFQIAFGLPLLFLVFIYLVPFLFKKKKLLHFLSFGVLAIPLSTYAAFELRHDFLQIRSFFGYLLGHEDYGRQTFWIYFSSRVKGALYEGYGLIPSSTNWINLSVLGYFLYLLTQTVSKKSTILYREIYFLFFYLYFGFWVISFIFPGVIWGYYYWPFLPLTLLILCSTYRWMQKGTFITFFFLILFVNLASGIQSVIHTQTIFGKDGSSWQFNYQLAQDIYKDAGKEFGYYIYTPDQYGYSTRFALDYAQQEFKNQKALPYAKSPLTYLIIAPPPSDRLFLDGVWWKKNQVKIDKKPAKVIKYKNGFKVEKYILTPKEVNVTSDPNLITSPLLFR